MLLSATSSMASASPVGPVGQVEFTTPFTSGSWTVPEGVTSICAVAVAGPVASGSASGTSVAHLKRGGTFLLKAINGANSTEGVGDVRNNGGFGGGGGTEAYTPNGVNTNYKHAGGGGGAGGYSGNGGNGGGFTGNASTQTGAAAGTGGGGGGGAGNPGGGNPNFPLAGGGGGGVGLKGIGSNGAAGGAGEAGGGSGGAAASGVNGGAFGGAQGGYSDGSAYGSGGGGNGGGLSYSNEIAVTAGESLSWDIGGGGLRIIWGAGRSYPSNAADA